MGDCFDDGSTLEEACPETEDQADDLVELPLEQGDAQDTEEVSEELFQDEADSQIGGGSSSAWEVPCPHDLFDKTPTQFRARLGQLGVTTRTPDVFRSFVADLDVEDVATALSEDGCDEDPEHSLVLLQAAATLLGTGSLEARAKRQRFIDYFRTPKVIQTEPQSAAGLQTLPRPKTRPVPTMPKLATRARSRLAAAKQTEDPTARATREENERLRQIEVITAYFAESSVPAYKASLASLDPARALHGCMGAARASTLRKHEEPGGGCAFG